MPEPHWLTGDKHQLLFSDEQNIFQLSLQKTLRPQVRKQEAVAGSVVTLGPSWRRQAGSPIYFPGNCVHATHGTYPHHLHPSPGVRHRRRTNHTLQRSTVTSLFPRKSPGFSARQFRPCGASLQSFHPIELDYHNPFGLCVQSNHF